MYLEAHRDSRYTNLSDEHRQAREDIMRQLEQQDASVRERAMVGKPAEHFSPPLTGPEREYQQHWQQENGLDPEAVRSRRRELDGRNEPEGKPRGPSRQPVSHIRKTSNRRGWWGAGRAAKTFTAAAAAAAPAPVHDAAALAWSLFTAGLGLCALYLILMRPAIITTVVGGTVDGFEKFASPSYDLLPAKPAAKTTAKPTTAKKKTAVKPKLGDLF